MRSLPTNHDAQTLALLALAWCLEDSRRADRLLGLTGLTTNDLRARIGEPPLQAAVLGFLEAHEPDLIACADAIGVAPAALIAARAELER
jgi:adenine/guanine phosphoribosyltransferase-like PRPP-binding protein